MIVCLLSTCEGHNDRDEFAAILHGIEHLAIEQRASRYRLTSIERGLGVIHDEQEHLMTDVATVKADFDTYKTDVSAAFARLQASIDAGNTDAAALADLDAAINGADADANAEDPAPVAAPPADGSGDGTNPGDGTPVV